MNATCRAWPHSRAAALVLILAGWLAAAAFAQAPTVGAAAGASAPRLQAPAQAPAQAQAQSQAQVQSPPQTQEPSELDRRVLAVAAELRCLVCQNQTIADSHADLAVDLRRQVRELLAQGKSEREVLDYMTARYGDFVLYRPPVRQGTWFLWFGPALLLGGGLLALVLVLRRRARLPPEAFEPEVDESPDAVSPAARGPDAALK